MFRLHAVADEAQRCGTAKIKCILHRIVIIDEIRIHYDKIKNGKA